MQKRLNDLSFVIGLFFAVVSLILLISPFFSNELSGKINIYTGFTFLVFGMGMIFVKRKNKE